jgi:hypothetical protein
MLKLYVENFDTEYVNIFSLKKAMKRIELSPGCSRKYKNMAACCKIFISVNCCKKRDIFLWQILLFRKYVPLQRNIRFLEIKFYYFLCKMPSSWDLSCWLVFFRWSISSAWA